MHKIKRLFGLLSLCLVNLVTNGQEVEWMTLQDAEAAAKEKPKPIFIDTYTHWCGWCKRLDATTFKDPQIVQYLNNNFYPVKYNAEMLDTVQFKGRTFVNRKTNPRRPTHDLTYELFGKGARISYPTMLLYDANFENPIKIPGYQQANTLLPFLVFYGEQQYKNGANPQEFAYFFKNAFEGDTTGLYRSDKRVNWMSLPAAFAAVQADTSKKVFVEIYTPTSTTTRVMDSTNFKTPAIVDYLNEHYYPVRFNAYSDESFELNGYEFKRSGNGVHDFVGSLIPKGSSMTIPAFMVFNSPSSLADRSPRYMSPQFMEIYLHFLKEELGKQGANFQQYYSAFKSEIRK